jgi:hypothetical protein
MLVVFRDNEWKSYPRILFFDEVVIYLKSTQRHNLSCTDMGTVLYPIRIRVRGYIIFLNICETQWILDIGYDTGMSIRYDMGTSTWAKMEYSCNLGHNCCMWKIYKRNAEKTRFEIKKSSTLVTLKTKEF